METGQRSCCYSWQDLHQFILRVQLELTSKKDYVLGAQTLGANARQIFIYVIFPAVLPDIFTGLRTSLGVEYTTLVAAEMVAAVSGIGWMVLDASNYLRSDIMFFGIILMGITGIVLDQILKLVEHYMVHWKGKN